MKYQDVCMEYAVLNVGKSIKKDRVKSLSPSLMAELLCHIIERLLDYQSKGRFLLCAEYL